jgi:Putative MetA-pathway of phenol degradation
MVHCGKTILYRGIAVGIALALLGATPALAENEPAVTEDEYRWHLSTSFNYLKGDYGTDEDTEIMYVPFTFGVRLDRFRLNLTVPYVRQTTQNIVLTGGGVAAKKNRASPSTTTTESRTEDGLGDILLRASYIVLKERPLLPEIEPYLKIKFPTADEDRGLGTGEFDETIGVDFSKTILDRLAVYLTLAYTFIGSPSGEDFDNSFGWSIGAAYAVTPPFSIFAFLDGSTAIAPDQDNPLELRVGAEYRIIKALKLTGSVMKGLSDGSADWGVSAGLALRF